MTAMDIKLEQIYKQMAARPPRKNEETLTKFDRRIFLYDIDEVNRQLVKTTDDRVTYANHRKAVEVATSILGNSTQHEIAMEILSHRYFADYRVNAFRGLGGFVADYTFVLKKVGNIFDAKTSMVNASTISSRLKSYTIPTLVQVNHLAGVVQQVKIPSTKFTLTEWATIFNRNAPESTTYQVAGLSL